MDKEEQKLTLACDAGNDVSKVYWYLNDKFFGSANAGEKIFFNPSESNIKISCTDDKGRSASIEIKVKFI